MQVKTPRVRLALHVLLWLTIATGSVATPSSQELVFRTADFADEINGFALTPWE